MKRTLKENQETLFDNDNTPANRTPTDYGEELGAFVFWGSIFAIATLFMCIGAILDYIFRW